LLNYTLPIANPTNPLARIKSEPREEKEQRKRRKKGKGEEKRKL